MESWAGEPIYLNASVAEDAAVDAFVQQFTPPLLELLTQFVGAVRCPFTSAVRQACTDSLHFCLFCFLTYVCITDVPS